MSSFFIQAAPDNAMVTSYLPHLVILSYAIACFGSYTGLLMASEYRRATSGRIKGVMLAGGALAMGCAIWSMHYIGMIAARMDMPMKHDKGLTALSMVIAVGIAVGFFALTARKKQSILTTAVGAVLLGTAICGMHYTGMAAMHMTGVTLFHLPLPFAASIVIALAASAAALMIFHRLERLDGGALKSRLQIAAGLMMGAAICGMHYTGMAAAVFVPESGFCITTAAGGDSSSEAYSVAAASGVILSIAFFLRLFRNSRGFFLGKKVEWRIPMKIFTISSLIQLVFMTIALLGLFHGKDGDMHSAYGIATLTGIPLVLVVWAFTAVSLRRWQEDLMNAQADAVKANAAKSEFLANMSHDLRTPMNGIIGLTRLLTEGRMYPEQAELIHSVTTSSETLLLLLNDILDFSKMEAGQLTLEEGPFHLRQALQEITNLLSPLASRKGLVLRYNYCDLSPSCVVGDMTRISQIVTNLVGNALKFTESGHVELSVVAMPDADGAYLYEISVEDTGIGIPPDVQKTLFRKFSQGDASINRRFGGTGLGLAITKMLAEKMGGGVTLLSELGKGTRITATLRLKSATAKAVKARKELVNNGKTTPRDDNFSDRRVLLVDDHPVNRLFAVRLLEKMGFTDITLAEDGLAALRRIGESTRPFDVILMDCQMPELDGLQTTRRIREMEQSFTKPRIPIIAMTAHAMASDRDNCLQAGMDDYVSKPINPQTLLTALQRFLSGANPVEGQAYAIPEPVAPVAAVDLEYLALFTDGDNAQEKLMADVFLSSGAEILQVLRRSLVGDMDADDWRKAAHKLKGSAGQLGAARLAAACRTAETGHDAQAENRSAMLREIERHFTEVQDFFEKRFH